MRIGMPAGAGFKGLWGLLAAVLAVSAVLMGPAVADERQALVEKARFTVESLAGEGDMEGLRRLLARAKGALVVPQLLKAGFFIGGEGGSGVLLARDKDGNWSPPAFYTMGAASLGFQFGAEAKEVILVIMTDKGLRAIIDNEVKLGADASVAVGPVGRNLEAATTTNLRADIYSYARSKGLFGGVSVEGAVISSRDEWNRDYYGKPVTAEDIVLKRTVDNAGAAALRKALKAAEQPEK